MATSAVKPSRKIQESVAGFSLLEMAIVLMIMGILMSGVLVSVSQTTLNARRATALAQLRAVEESIYGFAQSQGRLPCPATVGLAGSNGGYEDCTAAKADGFVPAATLGIFGQVNDDGLLVDAWQNPLRYSVVITAGAGNPNFTDTASIDTFFSASTLLTATNMLCVADTSECTGIISSDLVPAIVYSMGANWADFSSAFETDNAEDTSTYASYPVNGDQNLVSKGYVEDAVAAQFDDQLVWLSPYVLFNRMVSAGKLP